MASKSSSAGVRRLCKQGRASRFIVAIANSASHGNRAKVELLWLKNREVLLPEPPSLGDGLFVHIVGYMEKLCGCITNKEAQLFFS